MPALKPASPERSWALRPAGSCRLLADVAPSVVCFAGAGPYGCAVCAALLDGSIRSRPFGRRAGPDFRGQRC